MFVLELDQIIQLNEKTQMFQKKEKNNELLTF